MDSNRKIAVIGKGGTIGNAIIKLFEQKDFDVLGLSRHSTPRIDIDDPASIKKFFDDTEPLDGLICAAGNALMGVIHELTDENIEAGVKSKLMGQVNLVRNGYSKIKAGGAIVLTGGIFAYHPWPGTSAIAMVNAALEGFVKGAAVDLNDRIKINIVHPSLVRETAIAYGMDGSAYPPASEVAEAYLKAFNLSDSGKAVFQE